MFSEIARTRDFRKSSSPAGRIIENNERDVGQRGDDTRRGPQKFNIPAVFSRAPRSRLLSAKLTRERAKPVIVVIKFIFHSVKKPTGAALTVLPTIEWARLESEGSFAPRERKDGNHYK